MDAHQEAMRNQKVNNACGVFFGSANAAIKLHQHHSPADGLPAIEAYMGNISATATTNHAILDELLNSNAYLSVTTEKQHVTIESYGRENGTLR